MTSIGLLCQLHYTSNLSMIEIKQQLVVCAHKILKLTRSSICFTKVLTLGTADASVRTIAVIGAKVPIDSE